MCASMFLLLLLSMLQTSESYTDRKYTSAIYDQNVPFINGIPSQPSRRQALRYLMPRMEEYREVTQNASHRRVDILVFPEYGIVPVPMNRTKIFPFLEFVSFPSTRVLCNSSHGHSRGKEVQVALSCMARDHGIYISANLGEKVRCNRRRDRSCPSDNHYHYQTNVVYNPQGQIVARYRKLNLFMAETEYFNIPQTVDFSYFDTPFGRFGAIVCFDILFEDPTIGLIHRYNVDNILFPTAWMNVLPYFSANGFHQSFAYGMGVNVLAANLHIPNGRFLGSGIYSPGRQLGYINKPDNYDSTLLVAPVPRRPANITYRKPYIAPAHPGINVTIFGDNYEFSHMPSAINYTREHRVCSDDLCCRVRYRTEGSISTGEYYALGAFKGLHTLEGSYHMEVCLVMKCDSSAHNCSTPPTEAHTEFSKLELQGNFTTPPLPQLITSGVRADQYCFRWTGRKLIWNDRCQSRGVLSATLLARQYHLD